MKLSIDELAQMRATVASLLDELQLDAYLFDIEPSEEQWQVKVECACHNGWASFHLAADKDYLIHGNNDAVAHAVLLDDWRNTLSDCKPKP